MSQKKQYQWELFGQSQRLFRKHWLLFARTALVFFIPFFLIDRYFWNNFLLRQDIIFGYSYDVYYLLYLAIAVFVGLFFFWYLASLIKCIESADGRKPLGVLQSYKQSWPQLRSYIFVKCLYLGKVLLWSLLFVVPGIFFGILYSLSGMALLIDGKRGNEALEASQQIIRPDFFKYLGHITLLFLILFAACTPGIIILDTLMYFLSSAGYFLIALWVSYVEIGILLSVSIFMVIFGYYLYKNFEGKLNGVKNVEKYSS